jgi:hypothetical protein
LGMHLSIILYNTSSSPPLYSLGKHDVWCNIFYSCDLFYRYVLCWVITCSWQWWYSLFWLLHTCLLSSIMVLCNDVWVHSYVGGLHKVVLDWLGGGLVNDRSWAQFLTGGFIIGDLWAQQRNVGHRSNNPKMKWGVRSC